MSWIKKITLLLFCLCMIFSSSAQTKEIKVKGAETTKLTPVENRYAFIVGVDYYDDSEVESFTSCRIDATKFESFLKTNKGWNMPDENIEVLYDPKKDKIVKSFKTFLDNIKSPEIATLYFYFSGHGIVGSIVPSDYQTSNGKNLISYKWITDQIEKRNINARVFVLDACYSGSLITKKGDTEFDSNYASAIQGGSPSDKQITFTATSDNRKTDAGKNLSVFTSNFLEALEEEASDTDGNQILSSGELYYALTQRLETSNPPQFAGSPDFPMATYSEDIKVEITNTNSSNGSNNTPDVIATPDVSFYGTNFPTAPTKIVKDPDSYYSTTYYGLKDTITNEWIYPPKIYKYNDFQEGLATIKRNSSWGFINRLGEVVVPLDYDFAKPFFEGLALVRKKPDFYHKYFFINASNEKILPKRKFYYFAKSFSEGMAAIQDGDSKEWGFINKAGTLVIPYRFDDVLSFSEGLAAVEINDQWGFIDQAGNFIIPVIYSKVTSFKDGASEVNKKGDSYVINKSGDKID